MEIQYTVGTDDLVAFGMRQRSLQKTNRRSRIFRWVIISVIFCIAAIATGDVIGMLVVFGAFLLYCVSYYVLFLPWYIKKAYQKFYSPENAKGLLGPHNLILTPDWLIEQTDQKEVKYRWQHIDQVIHTPTHVLIFLNKLQAFVVPRRSLTDAQYEELKKELDQYAKSTGALTPLVPPQN